MIALNELLANKKLYENKYRQMGRKIDLTQFVMLENERKIVQIEAENLRAETSKLCASVASLRKQNADTSKVIRQINLNNSRIKAKQRTLDRMNKNINAKLRLLPNIPEYDNELNKQLETANKTSDFEMFKLFIATKFKLIQSRKSIRRMVKSYKNRVFQETELPIAVHCKNGIVLILQNYLSEEIKAELVEYLKNNSKYLVQPSVKNLKSSSTNEYIATINDLNILNVEIKGEYFTRDFSIKYKNLQLDTTKFVYEIDIIFKQLKNYR